MHDTIITQLTDREKRMADEEFVKQKQTLMIIDSHVYEVSAFEEQHPGEGIRNIYLAHYRFKDTSREFDQARRCFATATTTATATVHCHAC